MEAKFNENEIGSSAHTDDAWYNNKRKLKADAAQKTKNQQFVQ